MTKLKCIICNESQDIAYIFDGRSYCEKCYEYRVYCQSKSNPMLEHVFTVGNKDTCEYCGYVLKQWHRRRK